MDFISSNRLPNTKGKVNLKRKSSVCRLLFAVAFKLSECLQSPRNVAFAISCSITFCEHHSGQDCALPDNHKPLALQNSASFNSFFPFLSKNAVYFSRESRPTSQHLVSPFPGNAIAVIFVWACLCVYATELAL